jgi:ABC-2 type transport system permease protein
VIIRWREGHVIVANFAIAAAMTVCGVNVPLAFYPEPLEWVANCLPLTHGLLAIRGVIDGADAGFILRQAGLEALVGLAWLGVALATFGRFVGHGRRDGSLEFAT